MALHNFILFAQLNLFCTAPLLELQRGLACGTLNTHCTLEDPRAVRMCRPT